MKHFIAILLLFVSLSSAAQVTYQNNTIKVTGSAQMYFEPNEVHLLVSLTEVKNKNQNLGIQNVRLEFFKICNDLNISKSNINLGSTGSNSLTRRLSFWKGDKIEVLQSESYDVKFSDFKKMLTFIDKLKQPFVKAVNMGTQKHSKMTEFRKQVKIDAVKASREKAKYLAEASERTIGKTIYINEIEGGSGFMLGANYNRLSNSLTQSTRRLDDEKPANAFGVKPLHIRYEVEMICELK